MNNELISNVNNLVAGKTAIQTEVGFSKTDILYLCLGLFVTGIVIGVTLILISKKVNE